MSQKVVILDAGHGGINPVTNQYVTRGKRSPIWQDGSVYYEGVGNRDIVKRAAKLLVKEGVKVLYTVNPDDFNDLPLRKVRVDLANSYHRRYRNAIGISVHSNGYRKEQANGTEVFTSPGTTNSDAIATVWMHEISKQFPWLKKRTDFDDGDIDKEAKFTIINETTCPFILIETMFHTNEKECRVLMEPCNRQRIAIAIRNTVLKAAE